MQLITRNIEILAYIKFILQITMDLVRRNENFLREIQNKSAVRKGDLFEKYTKRILEDLGFSITKSHSSDFTNGNNDIMGDNGIDLFGNIVLQNSRYNIIVQCKCYQKGDISTEIVQSLDGLLSKYPNFIGVLMVVNKDRINQRAQNCIKNSVNNILCYDITDIMNILQEISQVTQEKQNQLTIEGSMGPGEMIVQNINIKILSGELKFKLNQK